MITASFGSDLSPREILGLPRPRNQQRLHAHQLQTPLDDELVQHPLPVAGRLARHCHKPARRACASAQSNNTSRPFFCR